MNDPFQYTWGQHYGLACSVAVPQSLDGLNTSEKITSTVRVEPSKKGHVGNNKKKFSYFSLSFCSL